MSRAERIRFIIASELCGGMPPSPETARTIYPDDRKLDALGIDSLDVVEIVMALEEEFSLDPDIPPETYELWLTVGDIIAYIAQRTEVAHS